jgi:hypothetical protein
MRSEPLTRARAAWPAARLLDVIGLRLYFVAWLYAGAALLGGGWDLHPSGAREIVGVCAGLAAGALLSIVVLNAIERRWGRIRTGNQRKSDR